MASLAVGSTGYACLGPALDCDAVALAAVSCTEWWQIVASDVADDASLRSSRRDLELATHAVDDSANATPDATGHPAATLADDKPADAITYASCRKKCLRAGWWILF